MKDHDKEKSQLRTEAVKLGQQSVELGESEAERKLAEEELSESEQSYSSLFKNNHAVMLLIDPVSADIIDANPAACLFYGWSQEELTSMKITDINMLSNEQVFREMERAKSEKRNHFFFRHRLANEEVRDVEVYSGPIRLHGKELLYSIIHDISERKRAEEALRESEERFRELADNIHEVFWLFDWTEQRVIYASPAYEGIWGRSIQDLYDRYNEWMDAIHPEDILYAQESFTKIVETGGGEPREYRIIRPDGEVRWVSDRGFAIRSDNGQVKRIAGIAEDITDRKSLEEQLLQTQKMEAVGTLAGGVAHDFNNLIQVIQGYAQLLLLDKDKVEPGYQELQEILGAAQRGGELSRRMLTFSRRVESEREPLNLNHQVREVRKLLKQTIPKMIEIELDLADDIRTASADARQFEQVIMNLALNARDAMPEGGKLVIQTENVTLDGDYCKAKLGARPGDYVRLSISDTGAGMDRNALERVFEPFFSTKEPGKGTGLGLAMVYGIIKNHDGYITCSTNLGEGTNFNIYLPVIDQAKEVVDSEDSEVPIMGGSETILLVDDEQPIRNLGERILKNHDYTVLLAADGESGLELYRQKPRAIDLVILDMQMPGMGGKKCLEKLLKIDPEAKVLIASGSLGITVGKAKNAGAKGFIGKPFDLKKMLHEVRRVLDED